MDASKMLTVFLITLVAIFILKDFIDELLEFGSWRSLMDKLTPEQQEQFLIQLNRTARENMKREKEAKR